MVSSSRRRTESKPRTWSPDKIFILDDYFDSYLILNWRRTFPSHQKFPLVQKFSSLLEVRSMLSLLIVEVNLVDLLNKSPVGLVCGNWIDLVAWNILWTLFQFKMVIIKQSELYQIVYVLFNGPLCPVAYPAAQIIASQNAIFSFSHKTSKFSLNCLSHWFLSRLAME